MDLNDLRSAVTVFSLLMFLAITAWAWWPRNRKAFDEAAQLPFQEPPGQGSALPRASLNDAIIREIRS